MSDARAEALLYLEWVRLALGGTLLPADVRAAPSVSSLPGVGVLPGKEGLPGTGLPGTGVPGGGAPGASRPAGSGPGAPRPPAAAGARGARVDAAGAATRTQALQTLARDVASCTRCPLSEGRTNTVFGEGSSTARLVVVGEAPGAEEDRTGRPFVGRAGELLAKMLAAIGLAREDVFILNVLKCRPPGNRSPRPDEVAACRPFLQAQLETLQPPLLLALGSHAARLILGTDRGITSLRGRFHTSPEGWRVMPSFHPAYLLRNPAAKREAWADLQRVAADLGIEVPPR